MLGCLLKRMLNVWAQDKALLENRNTRLKKLPIPCRVRHRPSRIRVLASMEKVVPHGLHESQNLALQTLTVSTLCGIPGKRTVSHDLALRWAAL